MAGVIVVAVGFFSVCGGDLVVLNKESTKLTQSDTIFQTLQSHPGLRRGAEPISVLYRSNMKASPPAAEVPLLTVDASVRDIALDWLSGNLFLLSEKVSRAMS